MRRGTTNQRTFGERVIAVTGAAGYIGSHVCLDLLRADYTVIAVDNLSRGSYEALLRVQSLADREFQAIHVADVCDADAMDQCFSGAGVTDVIHLAGYKAVAESVENPLAYFANNFGGTLSLVQAMERHGINRIVFSSSCTVYGDPQPHMMPLNEHGETTPANPYGRSKLAAEQLLDDVCVASPAWEAISLRYFNPIGADASGLIGEDPIGVPDNLLPFLMQVATGQRDEVTIFGDDYPTIDGTCVRDYLHVSDVARAHLCALEALTPGHEPINLATGTGSSVLEVIDAASRSVGKPLPYTIGPRRPGDAAAVYADPGLAHRRLGWRAERDLRTMCDDHWRWQQRNPTGYPYAGPEGREVIDLRVEPEARRELLPKSVSQQDVHS